MDRGTRSSAASRSLNGEARRSARGNSTLTSSHTRPLLTGLTIGAFGNRFGGVVQFGADRSEADLHGTFVLDRRHGNHGSGSHHIGLPLYGSAYGGFYYQQAYDPILGFGLGYYRPCYGYTYASSYYPDPYRYRFPENDVIYVDQVVENQTVYEGPPSPRADAPASTPTATAPIERDTYQRLIDPEDTTLVGQGNTAFVVGRYDDARRFYAGAMLADERDGYAKFLYALANFSLGDYDVAEMAIKRALLTTPELIEYPVDARGLYHDPLLLETQIGRLNRFVVDHPADRSAALLLGYVLYATGQPGRAMLTLGPLAASDPNDNLSALLRDAVLRVSRNQRPAE